ncbi:RxLR effector protein [Phytophthora megakarya]|uniref:RxLR effector protein n=1 Tax=Phytophthora megakarya TaxID=4795 RepID=A0A225WXK9_9STRA|nr:RxLR effector protein [Phytophthora megakarya]
MRTRSVFVLLVVILITCCNGFSNSENAVEVSKQHDKSISTPFSNDNIHRNLRTAAFGSGLWSKMAGILKRNPGLNQKVEAIQKNPAQLKALEKATKNPGFSTKLREYFGFMWNKSSKRDKFFIGGTLLLIIIGIPIVFKNYGSG